MKHEARLEIIYDDEGDGGVDVVMRLHEDDTPLMEKEDFDILPVHLKLAMVGWRALSEAAQCNCAVCAYEQVRYLKQAANIVHEAKAQLRAEQEAPEATKH